MIDKIIMNYFYLDFSISIGPLKNVGFKSTV